MSTAVNGRLVEVKTKFHREAIKPGGINRTGAQQAADRSVTDLRNKVEEQLAECAGPLVSLLQAWPTFSASQGCMWAGQVRDLAGLADMHLLTEVAMHTFDCLDAVMIDDAPLSAAEAKCFADALIFAQGPLCRGSDLGAYEVLLKELETLTTRVIERGAQGSARRT